jgi:hypothetical protein
LPYNRTMAYIQPRGRKRKLKILRLLALILIVAALIAGSVWTYNLIFNHGPKEEVVMDDVLKEMQGTYTRELVTITNPFDYVNNRLETVTINGKEIDLVALYDQYEEELNAQFLEIYLFLKPIYKEMISRDYTTEKRLDMFGNDYETSEKYMLYTDAFAKGLISFAESMNASTDPTFDRYHVSFPLDAIREYVMYKEPREVFLRMQDKPAFITRYDRQIFVYTNNAITYSCSLCPVPEPEK